MAELTKTEKRRDYNLRKKYKITLNQYNDMLEKQDFRCAVCKRSAATAIKALHVDHNHKTGHVRGLLCSFCNRSRVGALRDDKKTWEGIRDYISRALKEDKKWK